MSAEATVPSYEETLNLVKKNGRDEAWLREEASRINDDYGGDMELGLAAWMAAKEAGIEGVPEIQMRDASSEGNRLQLSHFSADLVRAEMALDQKKRTLFSVEGVVLNVRRGQTSKEKDKVTFLLVDETGKATVNAYGDAVSIFDNSGVKEGMHVHIPIAGCLGHEFPPDEDETEGRYWYTLTIPPFEDAGIILTNRDPDTVFKNPAKTAVGEGDPIVLTGILTKVDSDPHDACDKCGRWVFDDKPEQHRKCRGMKVVEQVSYNGTLVALNGQTFKVRWNHNLGKPKVKAMDFIRVRGWWTKRGSVSIMNAEKVTRPNQGGARPAKTAPAKARATAAPLQTIEATTVEAAETFDEVTPAPVRVAPKAVVKAAPTATNVRPSPEFVRHVERELGRIGPEIRGILLVNSAIERQVLAGGDGMTREQLRDMGMRLLDTMVTEGVLTYVDEDHRTVRLTGEA